ncbi:MAG: hypothetical protein SAL70_44115 [Scytonema sp. PMC 1070.18]|nr:hypothetical protein [Scytonema sp. PMC 1070.18]
MTNTPEPAPIEDSSQTISSQVQNLIAALKNRGEDAIAFICDEIQYLNPLTLPGAAKIGQFLLFLKANLKPKQYKEALANTLGWISSAANQLLKLAPILGKFTIEQLYKIAKNLSPTALHQLATGRTPPQVIDSMLEKATQEEISNKEIQQETKTYKQAQPKSEPTPWRYVGQGREYQPPRICEQAGLVIEKLSHQQGTPRRFLIEDAILLLAEKFPPEAPS